eukprot:gene17668-24018_t
MMGHVEDAVEAEEEEKEEDIQMTSCGGGKPRNHSNNYGTCDEEHGGCDVEETEEDMPCNPDQVCHLASPPTFSPVCAWTGAAPDRCYLSPVALPQPSPVLGISTMGSSSTQKILVLTDFLGMVDTYKGNMQLLVTQSGSVLGCQTLSHTDFKEGVCTMALPNTGLGLGTIFCHLIFSNTPFDENSTESDPVSSGSHGPQPARHPTQQLEKSKKGVPEEPDDSDMEEGKAAEIPSFSGGDAPAAGGPSVEDETQLGVRFVVSLPLLCLPDGAAGEMRTLFEKMVDKMHSQLREIARRNAIAGPAGTRSSAEAGAAATGVGFFTPKGQEGSFRGTAEPATDTAHATLRFPVPGQSSLESPLFQTPFTETPVTESPVGHVDGATGLVLTKSAPPAPSAIEALQAVQAANADVNQAVQTTIAQALQAVQATAGQVQQGVPENAKQALQAVQAASEEVNKAVQETIDESLTAARITSEEVHEAVRSTAEVAHLAVLATNTGVQQAVQVIIQEAQQSVPASAEEVQASVPATAEEVQATVPATAEEVQATVPATAEEVQATVSATTEEMQAAVPAPTEEEALQVVEANIKKALQDVHTTVSGALHAIEATAEQVKVAMQAATEGVPQPVLPTTAMQAATEGVPQAVPPTTEEAMQAVEAANEEVAPQAVLDTAVHAVQGGSTSVVQAPLDPALASLAPRLEEAKGEALVHQMARSRLDTRADEQGYLFTVPECHKESPRKEGAARTDLEERAEYAEHVSAYQEADAVEFDKQDKQEHYAKAKAKAAKPALNLVMRFDVIRCRAYQEHFCPLAADLQCILSLGSLRERNARNRRAEARTQRSFTSAASPVDAWAGSDDTADTGERQAEASANGGVEPAPTLGAATEAGVVAGTAVVPESSAAPPLQMGLATDDLLQPLPHSVDISARQVDLTDMSVEQDRVHEMATHLLSFLLEMRMMKCFKLAASVLIDSGQVKLMYHEQPVDAETATEVAARLADSNSLLPSIQEVLSGAEPTEAKKNINFEETATQVAARLADSNPLLPSTQEAPSGAEPTEAKKNINLDETATQDAARLTKSNPLLSSIQEASKLEKETLKAEATAASDLGRSSWEEERRQREICFKDILNRALYKQPVMPTLRLFMCLAEVPGHLAMVYLGHASWSGPSELLILLLTGAPLIQLLISLLHEKLANMSYERWSST